MTTRRWRTMGRADLSDDHDVDPNFDAKARPQQRTSESLGNRIPGFPGGLPGNGGNPRFPIRGPPAGDFLVCESEVAAFKVSPGLGTSSLS